MASVIHGFQPPSQRPSGPPVERLRVEVVRSYPHDRGGFTQGLVFNGKTVYESTGLVGQSSLREVDIETGRVLRKISVPGPYFAEGLALVGDRLIQLTWQHGQAFIYDRKTFARQGEFTYRGEGWGLCTSGDQLVMSDGSANLTVRRAADFAVARTLRVTLDGQALDQLNELECADGAIYANVWMRDLIVRIDPATGRVTHRIDTPNLLSPIEREGVDVLNGIAYDSTDKTFLITGKLWPRMFRVRFIK
ncbi:MAG TPA: glutaminyl-peptide cyclotransferase [Vicinamibacterales bacterium]|nr:glutaminyl-peptide cyclotransferase [Vicinamibacterales bacterium]